MPSILILGATGYIGSAICTHLLNAGHTVYGLARTPAKASALAAQEITPVLGSVESPAAITALLSAHPEITAVVDAAAVYGESVTLLNLIKGAGAARLKAFTTAGIDAEIAPKLGYVYLSGGWVYGSDKSRHASDANPLTGDIDPSMPSPVKMVGWRPGVERLILSAETRAVLDTAVVRPATTYGGASGIWSGAFTTIHAALKANDPVAKVSMDPGATPQLIHVADAAAGIACVIEQLPLFSRSAVYPVFDVMGQVESGLAVMEAAGRAMGFAGTVELVAPPAEDLLSDALGASVHADSARVKLFCGWVGPRRKTFTEGMDVYIKAWMAAMKVE